MQMRILLAARTPHAAQIGYVLGWLRYGPYAVDVFIVLSGYCLMLPVAQSVEGGLRGGLGAYLKRRARRILPPYYAALILWCLLLLAWRRWQQSVGLTLEDDSWWTQLSPGRVLAHLLLIHNWRRDWIGGIDPPMWSIATEWQIYFVFPALLLPVWRRLGSLAAIVSGFGVGLAPLALPVWHANLIRACPWYVGLFALGMAATSIGFSDRAREKQWNANIPWGVVTITLFGILCVVIRRLFPDAWVDNLWEVDALIGAMAACLLIYCARQATWHAGRTPSLVLRLLEARWAVALGVVSYSFYLVHFPILAKLNSVLSSRHLSVPVYLALLWGLGMPLVLGLTYLFHLAIERRFLPTHYKGKDGR
jgi:peptidoglycan/LPS O-acetylase OafA/YrhL